MADRYALSGNWNSTGTWSTSDGGASGASVPTSSDNVFFTSNSGNVTINATSNCLSLDATGYTGTLSGGSALSVAGTTFLLSAGMSYTATSTITFTSTSGTTSITTNGKTLGNVIFNGSGGTFDLVDDLTCANFTLTAGVFDGSSRTISCADFGFSGSTTRTLNLTNATVFMTGTLSQTVTTNLTFTATGSDFHINSSSSSLSFTSVLAWHNLHIGPRPSSTPVVISASLSINGLFMEGPCCLLLSTNLTLAVAPDWAGTAGNLISVIPSSTTARTVTVSSGNTAVEWCAFAGITFAGTGTFDATNSYNLGGVTNMTITPPAVTAAEIAAAVWAAVPAQLDANITQVNGHDVTGDGDATPWGPA